MICHDSIYYTIMEGVQNMAKMSMDIPSKPMAGGDAEPMAATHGIAVNAASFTGGKSRKSKRSKKSRKSKRSSRRSRRSRRSRK